MEICSICHDTMKPTDSLFTLSCGHVYHHKCIRGWIFQTSHSFVECPLCRTMNHGRLKQNDLSAKDNLQLWFHKDKRCICTTKKGLRCKHPSLFMNGGCCHIHGKNPLHATQYALYLDYFEYVMETTNHWITKIYMLDISRRLLNTQKDICSVQELQHYFLRFFHMCHYEKMSPADQSNPRIMYNYYDIQYPTKEWVSRSIRDKLLL